MHFKVLNNYILGCHQYDISDARVMNLLAEIYSQEDMAQNMYNERLLEAGYKRSVSECRHSYLQIPLKIRIVFQNLLLETNEDILQFYERVWSSLVQIVVAANVDTSVAQVVRATDLGVFASMLPEGSLKYVTGPVASMVLISWFKEIKNRNSSKNLDDIFDALD
ncbi:hypothetical protein RJT34_05200 [Clitoria ternatea]|uniref:Uncharacterized protein n=1 Tax=Clitoria ternatea TaxID=43366 RepID=A0AAN9PR34_CLITE